MEKKGKKERGEDTPKNYTTKKRKKTNLASIELYVYYVF